MTPNNLNFEWSNWTKIEISKNRWVQNWNSIYLKSCYHLNRKNLVDKIGMQIRHVTALIKSLYVKSSLSGISTLDMMMTIWKGFCHKHFLILTYFESSTSRCHQHYCAEYQSEVALWYSCTLIWFCIRLGKEVSDLIDHLVGIRIKWLFIHFAFFFLTKFNLKHDVNSGPDSGDSRTD